MYLRLFRKIFDGGLRGQKKELLTLFYLLSTADRSGVSDVSEGMIADANGGK